MCEFVLIDDSWVKGKQGWKTRWNWTETQTQTAGWWFRVVAGEAQRWPPSAPQRLTQTNTDELQYHRIHQIGKISEKRVFLKQRDFLGSGCDGHFPLELPKENGHDWHERMEGGFQEDPQGEPGLTGPIWYLTLDNSIEESYGAGKEFATKPNIWNKLANEDRGHFELKEKPKSYAIK